MVPEYLLSYYLYSENDFFSTWGHCVFRCIWRGFALKAHRVWFAHNTYYYISLTKWHDIMRWITIQVLYLWCTARHYIYYLGFILLKTHIFELYIMIISTVIIHVSIVSKNVINSKIKIISYSKTLNNIINVCDRCQHGVQLQTKWWQNWFESFEDSLTNINHQKVIKRVTFCTTTCSFITYRL